MEELGELFFKPRNSRLDHAVVPSESRQRRRIRVPPSSAFKRWSLPLDSAKTPVCSVHPGRTLQLTTAIGTSKVKGVLLDSEYSPDPPVSGNIIGNQRARLKSGRLQPLGLQTDPFLSSRTCLGVVTVESHRKIYRSLTAPATRTGIRRGWEKTTKLPQSFRRVSSANQATVLLGVDAKKLLTEKQFYDKNKTQFSQKKSEECYENVLLPPVSSGDMKIEITSTTKSETDKLPHLQDQLHQHSLHEAEQSNDSSSVIREQTQEVDTNEIKDQLVTNMADESNSSPTGRDSIQQKRRRRWPSGNKGGKLSYGWSDPQPLDPLKGEFPPITDTKRIRDMKRDPPSQVNSSEENEGISNTTVDVNKILADT